MSCFLYLASEDFLIVASTVLLWSHQEKHHRRKFSFGFLFTALHANSPTATLLFFASAMSLCYIYMYICYIYIYIYYQLKE